MKETIYTSYAQDTDITFILKDTYNKSVISTEIIGFYYGVENENSTNEYIGKLKATFEISK